MPRANRSFIPGLIWHITHRCHNRDFLLTLREEKESWIKWMAEAKKRFHLLIFNFMITSNHIHLLGMDGNHPDSSISKTLQLVQARVAQEYNVRNNRRGAFWEDRYHATAIESGIQLINCLTYIDMNMVRARVCSHPAEWPYCGYEELFRQKSDQRDRLIDLEELVKLFGVQNPDRMKSMRADWIDQAIRIGRIERDSKWTESIAAGGRAYLMEIQKALSNKSHHGEIIVDGENSFLQWTRKPVLNKFGIREDAERENYNRN